MKGETHTTPQSSPDIGARAPSGAHVSSTDRWLVRKMLIVIGRPPFAFRLWSGEVFEGRPGESVAEVTIRDRGALFKLLLNPELYFGDLYSEDRVSVKGDLVGFIEAAYRTADNAAGGWLLKGFRHWQNRPRPNTLSHSARNIYQHYDIGNDFYALWLDTAYRQYTCAYYAEPELTLEQAQIAKLHHVCRKLQLKPGETVVEAGCGWGGLARFMAEHYGVKVRAYNISHEQVAYARERIEVEGLADRVEYIEDDYRNITGEYDVFVSVGMLEHVGKAHYGGLGGVIDRVLKPNGRGLIHTIGRNKPRPMNAWIERRIFPGGYPPTLGEMMAIFEPCAFSVLDVENLRPHYAKTLEHWLERYEAHLSQVRGLFDEPFVRAWRLYLAGSIAAFTTSRLQLFQVLFSRPGRRDNPWTRDHLYRSDHAAGPR